jgi:hypothetical protein
MKKADILCGNFKAMKLFSESYEEKYNSKLYNLFIHII